MPVMPAAVPMAAAGMSAPSAGGVLTVIHVFLRCRRSIHKVNLHSRPRRRHHPVVHLIRRLPRLVIRNRVRRK